LYKLSTFFILKNERKIKNVKNVKNVTRIKKNVKNVFTSMVLDVPASENNTLSIRSLVVDEERMRPGHWLGTVLLVSFSVLTRLDDRRKGIWSATSVCHSCMARGANAFHMVQLMPVPPRHLLLH